MQEMNIHINYKTMALNAALQATHSNYFIIYVIK